MHALLLAMGSVRVSLGDLTFTTVRVSATATASYSLENDADVVRSGATHGTTLDVGDWIIPRGAAGANYEARVTVLSGALSSGTVGSWLPLNTTRTWTRQSPASTGSETVEFIVEIRRASNGVVVAGATIQMTAERV